MEIHIIRMSSSLCIKCLHRSSSYHWEDEFSSLCNCRQSDQQLIERVQLANVFSRMEEHHLKQNRGRNIFLSVLKRPALHLSVLCVAGRAGLRCMCLLSFTWRLCRRHLGYFLFLCSSICLPFGAL